MDDQKRAQLASFLLQGPFQIDADDLDQLLAIAAEQEALAGRAVAETNPALAAYLDLHPDVADDYRTLVQVTRAAEGAPADRPAATPLLSLPDPAAIPPGPPPPPAARPPIRLRPVGRAMLGGASSAAGIDEHTYTPDGLDLAIVVRLRVEDDLGTILLELIPRLEGADLPPAEARLLPAGAPDAGAPAIASRAFGARGTVVFSDLDLTGYDLRIELPDRQQVFILISAETWPRP